MTITKMLLPSFFICILICATYGREGIIYPNVPEEDHLATRIYCQVEEIEHFRYSSITKLWGTAGGDILLNADLTLHCLGDDTGGTYGADALKYRALVSNFRIQQNREGEEESSRRKRETDDPWEIMKKCYRQNRENEDPWKIMKKCYRRAFKAEAESEEEPDDNSKEEKDEEMNMNGLKLLYSTPFQFVQLANGSIPEIRFSRNEVNNSNVRNFKRHLVDAFATYLNLNRKRKEVVEKSLIGEHTSSYDVSQNNEREGYFPQGRMLVQEESTLVVSKTVTENDILKLAPSEGLNDLDNVDLKMQQTQTFQGGKLISSSGTSSLHIFQNHGTSKKRRKREDQEDISSYFQAHSSFDLQLQNRRRRSAETSEEDESQENATYLPASRFGESDDNSEWEKFRSFQQSIGDITAILHSLLDGQEDDFDEKLQIISDMVAKEVKLNLDHEYNSAANVVRGVITKEKMADMCAKNLSFCKDFLQLLALAGGKKAEHVLLSFLTERNHLNSVDTRIVINIISDVSRPSVELLNSLAKLISENKLKPDVLGSVCLVVASIGFGFKENEKSEISRTLVKLLRSKMDVCHSDPLILDVLEAIGNLGSEQTVPHVLEVSRKCKKEHTIQIACVHALRHSVHLPSVQKWMRNKVTRGDCDLMGQVVGALLEKIQNQEMQHDVINWPRYSFNDVDGILKKKLFASSCSPRSIVSYFSRKKNAEANEIAESFQSETELENAKPNTRRKRSSSGAFGCEKWTKDYKNPVIQSENEFASDRATYNKKLNCLITKRLGITKANAEIYAGIFAGIKKPSFPPNYKIFTKFALDINFLEKNIEIGSFYFYHQLLKTKRFVRILGQTREESDEGACLRVNVRYRYDKHIPLYKMYIWIVQVSLGIQLGGEMALNIGCPENEIKLQPKVVLRAAGEAMGTIAFIRAGLSVGANFNYKLQFFYSRYPNICVRGYRGYDPMSVSVQTWIQFWKLFKGRWGKRWTWSPGFLSWDMNSGHIQPWFQGICF